MPQPTPDLASDLFAAQGDPPPPAVGALMPGAGFQFRGGSFTVLVLRLSDPKDAAMFQSIADKVAQAPNFFRHAPVVVDLEEMQEAAPFNIAELGRRLRQHQLVLIGVQNATADQVKAAANAGLCVFPEGRRAPLPAPGQASGQVQGQASGQVPGQVAADAAPAAWPPLAAAPVAAAPPARPAPASEAARPAAGRASLLVTQPVRSGQRIYAQGTDLVVLSSISPGAELLADGHIHVYGALRGRALAGVAGDAGARIFCHSLEAELVSVAGYWRVREDLPELLIGKAVQIGLDGERLAIEPLP
jgi:septum site-determining protein MinC